jgi:hypothetical protein
VAKLIRLTPYAKAKFIFLREHGFQLEEEDVRRTVVAPDRVSRARMGRWVAQRGLSERHVLRVIYEESPHERVVVTFYPARRSRYESTHEI